MDTGRTASSLPDQSFLHHGAKIGIVFSSRANQGCPRLDNRAMRPVCAPCAHHCSNVQPLERGNSHALLPRGQYKTSVCLSVCRTSSSSRQHSTETEYGYADVWCAKERPSPFLLATLQRIGSWTTMLSRKRPQSLMCSVHVQNVTVMRSPTLRVV